MKELDSKYRWVVMKEDEKYKGSYKIVKFLNTIPCDIQGYAIAKAMCKPDEIVRYYDTIAI